MAKPDNLHGKEFEKLVNDVMHPLFLKYPCYWARIIDSAAAGNLIEAREGDFELSFPTQDKGKALAFTVECKASSKHLSLAASFRQMLRPKQVGKMRLKIRGGFYGMYLFYSVENEEIEAWSAAPLIAAFNDKKVKFFCQPAFVVSKTNFPRMAESWVKNPQQFLDNLIRSETVPVGV